MFLYLLFITIIVCMSVCADVHAWVRSCVCMCVCCMHTMPQQVLHSSEENPQTLLLSVTVGSGD